MEHSNEVLIQLALSVDSFQLGIAKNNKKIHLTFWNLFAPWYKTKIKHLNNLLNDVHFAGLIKQTLGNAFSSPYYLVSNRAEDDVVFLLCNDFKRSFGSLHIQLSKSRLSSRFLVAAVTNPEDFSSVSAVARHFTVMYRRDMYLWLLFYTLKQRRKMSLGLSLLQELLSCPESTTIPGLLLCFYGNCRWRSTTGLENDIYMRSLKKKKKVLWKSTGKISFRLKFSPHST